jgi:uncharacterized membrane protein SirB2
MVKKKVKVTPQFAFGTLLLLSGVGLLVYHKFSGKALPRVLDDYRLEVSLIVIGLAGIVASNVSKNSVVSNISSATRAIL